MGNSCLYSKHVDKVEIKNMQDFKSLLDVDKVKIKNMQDFKSLFDLKTIKLNLLG